MIYSACINYNKSILRNIIFFSDLTLIPQSEYIVVNAKGYHYTADGMLFYEHIKNIHATCAVQNYFVIGSEAVMIINEPSSALLHRTKSVKYDWEILIASVNGIIWR